MFPSEAHGGIVGVEDHQLDRFAERVQPARDLKSDNATKRVAGNVVRTAWLL